MFKKVSSIIFCCIFILMIAVPLLFTNLKPHVISEDENRELTQMARLYTDDGKLNTNFLTDFEAWFNDNIGFRSQFVLTNAKLQYYGFDLLANNSDMLLGPNGELNYATSEIIKDYQHLNLFSEKKLKRIAKSYQIINDYLENQGIQYYYYQCWDKQSIYPEQFPKTIIQYGNESKTDQKTERVISDTTVKVISPKEKLIEEKANYEIYSTWGDPTHWTQRGAYIGYQMLMNEINKENQDKYKVLTESDYNITLTDQGKIMFGGIHKENISENFEIKNPQAYLTNEKLTLLRDDQRHRFFTNDSVDNSTRVLILGDSYFNSFIVDDIAESFHETIMIWGDYTESLKEMIETYQPDIVINECAERVDRSELTIRTAKKLNKD